MEVCLLCNGLTEMHIPCMTCMHELTDEGPTSYFGDSYGPYEELSNALHCGHLLQCSNCASQQIFYFRKHSDIDGIN